MAFLLIGLVLGVYLALVGMLLRNAWRKSKTTSEAVGAQPVEREPTPACPPEVIRTAQPIGGCGVRGCSNPRRHSHVEALVAQLKGKK
jgi:hypothetical protein